MKRDISGFGALPDEALISTNVICAMLDLSTSATQVRIYHDPTFPRPVKLSKRCTRFRIGEVRAWIAKKDAETEAQLLTAKKKRPRNNITLPGESVYKGNPTPKNKSRVTA